MNDYYERLRGKEILGFIIDDTKQYLGITTPEGTEWLYTEGDCCSESWMENVTGVQEVIGGKITKIEETDLPDVTPISDEDRGCGEYVQAYSFKIFTDNARVLEIEFRNSSNGYYGGDMRLVTAPTGINVRELTEDF